jgi:phosphoenolpyruvate carboxylase
VIDAASRRGRALLADGGCAGCAAPCAFGFHLATVDLRQNSTCEADRGIAAWRGLNYQARRKARRRALPKKCSPRLLGTGRNYSEQRWYAILEIAARVRLRLGADAIRTYVIRKRAKCPTRSRRPCSAAGLVVPGSCRLDPVDRPALRDDRDRR